VPGAADCRIAAGTADFTTGPAMTRAQAVQAIAAGIALVRAQKQNGAQLLATGEMGIGNTTTSSAVASVLLGRPVTEMTGRGAGLSDAGLHRKIDAIERGIARNHPDAADPLGVLAALGGFDIAGLCGVFLGGALERLPIVMDGFISGVAALCAVRLCPAAEKLQISCRAGRVCPLLCPPVKAQSDEKPVSHRPVFSVSPPFPPGFFLHLFDIIHPSQRLYRELFTLSTGFSTPSPP
jgi:nicotinate-nucleotide--dimethylbenzimidazole phosphoribosyltransferase